MLPVASTIAERAQGLTLEPAEAARYSRHLLLPEVGVEGQKRLKAARIVVIGAGGLGSPVSLYLAAAGVGTLGLVDFDVVDTSNLQRQVLYSDRDAGRPKLEAAKERLSALSPRTTFNLHAERLDATNVERILAPYDIVVDGTDNFATRFLVNDACVFLGKPNVYGSIFRFDGQASLFYAPHGPCYRCLFPAPPPPGQVPSCAEGGVLGVLPAQIGALQATEALKLALGIGTPLMGRLVTYDALDLGFQELRFGKDPDCPVCGAHPSITTVQESAVSCALPQAAPAVPEILVADLARRLRQGEKLTLVDVRAAAEAAICRIPAASLLPLPELERGALGFLETLPRDTMIVLHCKSGARSARAQALLAQRGFTGAVSLAGGILAWIEAEAPHLTRY